MIQNKIMLQNKIPLSIRLKKIYDIMPECNCFADIGTDHAYLPVYMCAMGKCKTAIASDIVSGPLERANATILKFGMRDKISVRLGPGVSTLSSDEADVVSIAGMGGLIIAQILEQGRDVLKNATKIIVQPMTAVEDLREYLYKNNWNIDQEYLVKENDKLYNILSISLADSNTAFEPDDIDIFIGRHLIEDKPDLYNEYLERKIFKLDKMIAGLKKSSSENSADKIKKCEVLLNKTKKLLEDSKNV